MSTRRPIGAIVSFIVRLSLICVVLAISIVIAVWLTVTRTVPPSSVQSDVVQAVEVLNATPQQVARTWRGYGTAEALDTSDVPAEVPSVVIEIPSSIEVGRAVVVGDLIVRLDSKDFERQEEIAQRMLRELAARKDQLDIDDKTALEQVRLSEQDVSILKDEQRRVEDARESGAATPRETDMVRQRLIQAELGLVSARERLNSIPISRELLDAQEAAQKASRDLARRNVERCRITSPINGIIEALDVEVGERVDTIRRIARVVNPERIVVPVRLPSSARASVAIGNFATIRAEGAILRKWEGEVSRISPVDDANTRTMVVYIEPTKPGGGEEHPIAPGTFVSAEVVSTESELRIVVPRSAVRNERIWFVDSNNEIGSTRVDVAFPLESDSGADRRLVLSSLLPDGILVVIDAVRTPPNGTEVTPVLRGDPTTTVSGPSR